MMCPYLSLSRQRTMIAGECDSIILTRFLHPYHFLLLREVINVGKNSTLDLSWEDAGAVSGLEEMITLLLLLGRTAGSFFTVIILQTL